MGTKDLFDLVTLSMIKAKSSGLNTDAHFIPTKINYKELEDIIEMLNVAEFDELSILNFVPQGRGKINEDLLYMAIEQMEGMNIRRLMPVIRNFLKNEQKPAFAKSLLIELMIDQEIDEDLELVKNGINYDINPSFAPLVLNQEVGEGILKLLSEAIEDENPSLFALCEQFLSYYLYLVYPKYIDDYDYRPIAGAIHYHLASMQYIDIEMEDIEFLYNCDKEDVLEKLNEIKEIEY